MGITPLLRGTAGRAVHTAGVAGLRRLVSRHLGQEVARRNAMVASTALTQRRHEREEVERFLALQQRRYDARAARTVAVRPA